MIATPVYFIGAGPGDPELLTIKAKNAIESSDVIIYAGSLVSKDIIKFAPKSAEIWDSSSMTLEQTHAILRDAAQSGRRAARIHTGDPSIFGALAEQLSLLDKDGIPWEIIPGITAAMAAAAKAGVSFSIPGLRQTLIFTRMAGRTPVPPKEDIANLARTGAALAIYLSGNKCAEIKEKLAATLPGDTPVLCCSRVSLPDEQILRTTIGNLAALSQVCQIGRQTLLLVLPGPEGCEARSNLYDASFSHSFRKSD